MARKIKDPEQVLSEVTDELKALIGDGLVSVILYGSAASGDYIAGTSDINVMVIVSEDWIDRLGEAMGLVARWRKRNVATPLFLTETYLNTSLDVFPLEYLNFQKTHRTVYGKDVLQDLTFDPVFVRLQCEREVKGKLLLLREAFLESGDKRTVLRQVLSESLRPFLAVFVGILFLQGKDIPTQKREIVASVCSAFELDENLFSKLMDLRGSTDRLSTRDLQDIFEAYLREIRKLWECIDKLEKEMV